MPDDDAGGMEREAVRMADGRRLTFYRFSEPAPRPATSPAPAPGPPPPDGGEEEA